MVKTGKLSRRLFHRDLIFREGLFHGSGDFRTHQDDTFALHGSYAACVRATEKGVNLFAGGRLFVWGLFEFYVFPQICPGLLHVLSRT